MRRYTAILLSLIIWILMCECGAADSAFRYEVAEVHPVAGRQGICTEAGYYWVSGSGTLTKYDADWNLVVENTEPFDGYELEVNHIGDMRAGFAYKSIRKFASFEFQDMEESIFLRRLYTGWKGKTKYPSGPYGQISCACSFPEDSSSVSFGGQRLR